MLGMDGGVTRSTKGIQVVFCIGTRVTPETHVVDLQVRVTATGLTSPAITRQYLLAQAGVSF
jgi:hypothetical protein